MMALDESKKVLVLHHPNKPGGPCHIAASAFTTDTVVPKHGTSAGRTRLA